MSPSNQLTREELLEMAELEALGALDEYEHTLFHRAALNAPTAVQEEIRNLQASIVADTSLLPNDEPSPELKLQVLAAVAHAIDEENEQLAPLATIGGGHRGGTVSGGAGRSGFAQIHLWRAAAFALAAGLLVCLFFLGRVVETNRTIAQLKVSEGITSEIVRVAGVDVQDMFNRPHISRALPATFDLTTNRNRDACGVLLIDENRQQAIAILHGFDPALQAELRIVVTTEDGRKYKSIPIVKDRGSTMAVAHLGKILPDVAMLATATIEVVGANGIVLMRMA